MKITKIQWMIHVIVAFVYTVAMLLLWQAGKDIQFWLFFVSTWIMIGNSLVVCNHIENTKDNNSTNMDLSLYVVPAVTYVAIVVLTAVGTNLKYRNVNLYLVLHLFIFAASVVLQLLMINGRKGNITQEAEIKADIINRDELIRMWTKIVSTVEEDEARSLAKKIENEVRYSDPVVPAQLIALEEEIHEKSANLLMKIKDGTYNTEMIIEAENEVLEMVKDRNEKGKLYK